MLRETLAGVCVVEAGPGKAAATLAARVRLDARVTHAVGLEVRAGDEALPTHLTAIAPLASVDGHVVLQLIGPLVSLVTQVTCKRSFVRVRRFVAGEVVPSGKGLSAHITLVRFFSRVGPHVII